VEVKLKEKERKEKEEKVKNIANAGNKLLKNTNTQRII